ncbi:toxin-antitoxin system HicB family antitoxin [Clostridium baratii]|uniref:toxin-antitoxin system HicB family antitoxin n=1 Tax=Clostridium baratii TaxID=1561 RepID=UPI0030CD7974
MLKQRLTVRIPRNLNIILTNKANETGISKNSLVLQILWKEVNEQLKDELINETKDK